MQAHRDPMGWDASHAHALDDPRREREVPAAAVIDLLELGGGETVVDFGAGTGRLTVAVDGALDQGTVIALENDREMCSVLEPRLADRHSATTLYVESGVVPLPDGSVDRILCVDVLHHIAQADLNEMRRLIRAAGHVVMIDWERGASREHGPPDDVCLSSTAAAEELATAGFSVEEVPSPFAHRYALLARPLKGD